MSTVGARPQLINVQLFLALSGDIVKKFLFTPDNIIRILNGACTHAVRPFPPEFRLHPSFASGARGPFRSLRSLKRTIFGDLYCFILIF